LKWKIDFLTIEVDWIIHATEDEEKVNKRITSFFPLSERYIKSLKSRGHFGNPIILCKVKLSGSESDEFLRILFSSFKADDKKKLEYELLKHLDENGAFYIRISKQLLFENKISISETDVIRIKLKPKSSLKLNEKLSFYRRLLK